MIIILQPDEVDMLGKLAKQHDVEPSKLYDMYEQIMTSNLEQDLWDIINENLEELGGRDFEREAYEENLAYDKSRHGE